MNLFLINENMFNLLIYFKIYNTTAARKSQIPTELIEVRD